MPTAVEGRTFETGQNGDQAMANQKQETPKQSAMVSEGDAKRITQAIAEGKSLIEQGKTKVEAAMVIYRALEPLAQEVVVAAMIEGASLTPKGALTYWYNCRRRLAKETRDLSG